MSIYFDRQLESSCQTAIYVDSNWHKSYATFAAASYSNDGHSYVQFYNDEGSVTSKTTLPIHGLTSQIVGLQWHPSRKILAIACNGGDLFTWNDYEQELRSSITQHGFGISVLRWTTCGSRLISADANGALVAWKVDSKGNLDLVFHHELQDPITHVAFRSTLKADSNRHAETLDFGGLARAAVSGDEQALDLFSASLQVPPIDGSGGGGGDRRLSQLSNRTENGKGGEDLSFYVSVGTGSVYLVDDDGSCVEVLQASYRPHCLLYHQERSLVIVVNNAPLIVQYAANTDGTLEEISNVKLSVKMNDVQVVWAGPDVLALSVGDLTLRFWDVDSGDSYNFSLVGRHLRDGLEHITTLAFNMERAVLAAGTNFGNIHMWLYTDETKDEPEKQWLNYSICNVRGSVKQLKWSGVQDNLAVNASSCLYMLTAQKTFICLKNQVAAVQLSANRLLLEFLSNGRHLQVSSPDVQIKGIDITTENLVLWSGKKVSVYEIAVEGKKTNQIGSFPCEASSVVINEQTLYTIEAGKIQARTFQGTIKQSLTFLENEGDVTQIDVCGANLVAATSLNIIKMWEISRREAKPFTSPKKLSEFVTDGGQITSVRCNCNGSKVSLLMSKDNRLIIWDIEGNDFLDYDFGNDTGKSSEVVLAVSEPISGHEMPISHFWDHREPRLLVCEISQHRNKRPFKVVSLFVTSEYGILLQDGVPHQPIHASLLGIQVPNYHFLKQSALGDCMQNTSESDYQMPLLVDTVWMRDFAGMENDDVVTRDAMINFGFHLTVGNMDEAFKAIKKIKSGEVWENMAKMCVKTKRMDVALVCLGHMANARGARAVRLAMIEPELDARVAALAIQLGMLTEAEQLYQSCHRYDLLNSFYQASGQWEKALSLATSEDRIHLRSTYYNYAKYLEAKGDILDAISNYEKSETQQFEVPRMLFDELPALEHYVIGRPDDKKLLQWWAQYVESTGEMGTAIEYYEKANDHLSLVRVYCYCDNLTKAAEIANDSGDRAACYHLGRRYENDGNIREAVHFFERARAYGNAIRICKEHNMEDQLLNLALMGGPNEMVEVARYYESQPDQVERAVMLYQKGGLVTKAAELALKSGRHAALELLTNELDENTDPSVLRRCAEFFVEGGHHSKAVYLLAKAKEYLQAVTLCLEHNVILNEDLVEMLTPSKDEMQSMDERGLLLEKLAEGCYSQGNYHLATKKFTQAGNKLKAMKALLKSGDTERIVFFANVSRQKEIYIMAANYLQTLDWRQDQAIMKNIVAFYTKGKAPELLAGFYDACAQMEIDEFQNYNKALSALKEAYKCMSAASTSTAGAKRSGGGGTIEDKLAQLRIKLDLVNKFVEVRRVYEEDPSEAMKMCQSLLDETNLDIGIRPGDVYGFMVEHFAEKQNYKMAYNLIEEMRSKLPNANVAFYVDTETLKTIQRNLNLPSNDNGNNIMAYNQEIKSNYDGDGDDEIAEVVKYEI